ncbi:MAG TPA: GTP 3',8-cyclase MoaA [Acidimicrobiales bacterium]|nr:GTP 3',8-cyclase MoaA [Acidimicrobiales bacterium]
MNADVRDARGRPLRDLRLSVTDRCDLRCSYCMPEREYTWLPRADILTFEECEIVVAAFAGAGVRNVRVTGGEPLLRRDLPAVLARIANVDGIEEVSLTTNGTRLAQHAAALRSAGLARVTVSLDTLRPERHARITSRDNHATVLAGIGAVSGAGFTGTKINTVVMRGVNDDELVDLLDFASTIDAEVRFVEYMDVGGATNWNAGTVVSAAEIRSRIGDVLGEPMAIGSRASAPAVRYQLPDGRVFGIIASTTTPFCAACDRSRVTADGVWYRCLYAVDGTDLRTPLRAGATVEELTALIADVWSQRADQGAVDRLGAPAREASVPVTLLRRDPHLEMHTRGG